MPFFAECAVGKTWRAIMPPWTFCCSPVRRKLSGTFCWKAWPAVWLRSAYRYAASADVVLDGINGLQAEKGDEEGFYSAMRRLLEDGEMIRRLGKQARRTVNSRTWDSIHDRFEELLASVAREENGTGCARPAGCRAGMPHGFFVGPSSGNERLQGGRMPEVSETCPGWKNCAGGGYCGCLGFVPRQPLAAEAYALCPHLVEKDGTGGCGSPVPARKPR